MESREDTIKEMIAQREELDARIQEMESFVKKHREFADIMILQANEEGLSLDEIALMISDNVTLKTPGPKADVIRHRRKRKLKVFKNPHTGEVVETKGGNHKTLKAWKEEYGKETVDAWEVAHDDSEESSIDGGAETTSDDQLSNQGA